MIDFTKPVQTREGRRVRILATDADGQRPIVGQMASLHGGTGPVHQWKADGTYGFSKPNRDLINVEEEVVTWSYFGNNVGTGINCYGSEYDERPPCTCQAHKGLVKITRKGGRVVKLDVVS